VWLLAGCLVIALSVEAVARVGFDRASKIQRRIAGEYRLARAIGHDAPSARAGVLVVGNSLLDAGVEFDRMRQAFDADWDARRLIVEQTRFFDWYYGLRRLFGDGARPEVLVLMLSPRQWVQTGIRGDYFAHYMMNAADLIDVARDLDLHPTQVTGFAVARFSTFWGARAEIRNFVLGHTLPDLGRLMKAATVVDPRPMIDDEVEATVRPRIERLRRLLDGYQCKLVVVVPPLQSPQDGGRGLVRAASAAGVTALRPIVSGSLSATYYDDAEHLNPTGASVFTDSLISGLRAELTTYAASRTPGRLVQGAPAR
jgi:hypothetical protein